jgi:hypothetical protein
MPKIIALGGDFLLTATNDDQLFLWGRMAHYGIEATTSYGEHSISKDANLKRLKSLNF